MLYETTSVGEEADGTSTGGVTSAGGAPHAAASAAPVLGRGPRES